jgi:hypothetical protein
LVCQLPRDPPFYQKHIKENIEILGASRAWTAPREVC